MGIKNIDNQFNFIYCLLFVCLLSFQAKLNAQITIQPNDSITTVFKDSLGNRIVQKRNPFNPWMDVQKVDNYSYIRNNDYQYNLLNNDSTPLPYFKPVVFIPNTKPKLLLKPIEFNISNVDLNLLRTNDTIVGYWEKYNKVGLNANQNTFVDWNAGGDNSISGLFKGDFKRTYIKGRLNWDTNMSIKFGMNKQKGRESRKTDDEFQLNSSFGHKTSELSNWYYMAKFNLKTQFMNGYAYPNIDLPISKFFAPIYLFLGVGGEYSISYEGLKVYVSPLTLKSTFVRDQRLADQGAFGVEKAIYDSQKNIITHGKKVKAEVGFLIINQWKKEIFKNITINNRLTLYSDYMNNFGNIDIDWQIQLDMKINQYITANVGVHLIYDDDIKSKKEIDKKQIIGGPKIQFKQMAGIGLSYVF